MTLPNRILIINGPNLNMLGTREPEIYGYETLDDIEDNCLERAAEAGFSIEFRQSNSEGELVDWIQEARSSFAGVIINPAAYSHTSIAIHDALAALSIPIIEVHLSNIYKREAFRHHSYVSALASGVICGFGAQGYGLAIDAMAQILDPDPIVRSGTVRQ